MTRNSKPISNPKCFAKIPPNPITKPIFSWDKKPNPITKPIYCIGYCIQYMGSTKILSGPSHNNSVHRGISYPYDQCDYKAKANQTFHIKSDHDKISYSCDQCNSKASGKSDLKLHINSLHNKTSSYPCDQSD